MSRAAATIRTALLILCGLTAMVAPLRAETGASAPSESEVTAAFILNFAKFAEWPDSTFAGPSTPLIIGVYGEHPVYRALQTVLQDKSVQDHPVLLEVVERRAAAKRCHVLFLPDMPEAARADILARLADSAILTIGAGPGFVDQGGMLGLVPVGKKLQFEVNHAVVRRSGLVLSSKLLALASRVIDADGQATR